MELRGEALWDAQAQHLRSFEMGSDGVVVIDFELEIAELELDLRGSLELSLTLEHTASVEQGGVSGGSARA